MKKLYYEEGPKIMGCGIAGQFKIGVPKEVPDDVAEVLLRKGRLKEYQENQPEIASGRSKKGKEE
ncbi:MAG TPA: hypothetical protein PK621_01855 [Syntrophales bacterium]|nr:hypothetical protein [Syntrophales bacterium]